MDENGVTWGFFWNAKVQKRVGSIPTGPTNIRFSDNWQKRGKMALALFCIAQWSGFIHVSWWWSVLFILLDGCPPIRMNFKFSKDMEDRIFEKYIPKWKGERA